MSNIVQLFQTLLHSTAALNNLVSKVLSSDGQEYEQKYSIKSCLWPNPYDSPQVACVQRWMSMLRMFSLTPLAACSAIIDSACIRIKSSLTRTFRCGCGQVHCQRYTWSGQELHHETTSTLRQVGVHHPIWPGWLSLVWWYARQTGTWNKPQFAHSPGCCSTPLNSIIWKYFSRGYPTER